MGSSSGNGNSSSGGNNTGSMNENNNNIVDSTRPGFVSTYVNPREKQETEQEEKQKFDHKPNDKILENNLKKAKKPTRSEEAQAADLVKSMLKKRAVKFQPKHLIRPSMVKVCKK